MASFSRKDLFKDLISKSSHTDLAMPFNIEDFLRKFRGNAVSRAALQGQLHVDRPVIWKVAL